MLPLIITDLIRHPGDRRMDRPEVTIVTPRRMDLPGDLRDHMDLTMLLLLVRRLLHLERPAGLQLPMADLLHIQVMKFDTCLKQSISGMKNYNFVGSFESTRLDFVACFFQCDF